MINNVSLKAGTVGMSTRINANFSPAVTKRIESVLPAAIDELALRSCTDGQFTKWAHLPEKQLKRVDEIYALVRTLKGQTDAKMLTVLGIGGSKHTIEHMLGINGLNIKGDKVKFFSDIDSTSFDRYLYQIDNDVKNSNYLVVSKSGSTFETKDGMMRILDMLEAKFNPPNRFNDLGVFPKYAMKEAGKYMVAVTDANAEKSELRRLSDEQHWAGNLYIHDDVGGRNSFNDDHVLFTLAYAGMKKEDMISMLEGARWISGQAFSHDMQWNQPIMQAAFWVAAKLDGIKNGVHQYLGEMFEATVKMHTQMQNESVKDTSKQIAKTTDAMHHSSEAWYKLGNKFAFAMTAPVDNGAARENVEGYISAIEKTNSEYGPSMVELLETRGLGLKPETAGAMTQARAFSTVYQEIIEKMALGEPLPKVLASVLQPNVEAYKSHLKPTEGNQPPVVAGRISVNA